jgi:hypothetical protein
MKLKNHYRILILCFSFFSILALASSQSIYLVLDALNKPTLPKSFRTTSGYLPPQVSTTGLNELHAIGSAQFSAKELQTVLTHVQNSFIIVDLRQESHGFLNGNAISWYNEDDSANQYKTSGQIEQIQAQLLANLALQSIASVRIIKTKNKAVKATHRDVLTLPVKHVYSEANLAKQLHVGYKRFYITDHHVPDDQEVDRFVQWVQTLPPNTWLYFHCRGGKGRTTTFMVMYDMMKNAKKLSFATIIQRQADLGGINILQLPSPTSPKYAIYLARLTFLQHFYNYCAANTDHFQTKWSHWH